MSKIRFFGKVILAILFGMSCASLWIQHDERILDLAHEKVVTLFKTVYKARFCAERCQINPLSLSITFNNVHVEPLEDSQWAWSADTFTLKCHPFSYFYSKKIGITLHITPIKAETKNNDTTIAIIDHVKTIITAPDMEGPFDVRGIFLDHINLYYHDSIHHLYASIISSVAVEKKDGSAFTTTIMVQDGYLKQSTHEYIQNLSGSITIVSKKNEKPLVSCDFSCISPQFPDDSRYKCFVKGSWNGLQGSCMIHTQDHSLLIHPCTITKKGNEYDYNAKLLINADLLKRLIIPGFKDTVEGMLEFVVHGSTDGALEGVCKGFQLNYKKFSCDTMTFSFSKEENDINGLLHIDLNDHDIEGEAHYSLIDKKGSYSLKNNAKIPLYGYWEIPAEEATVSGEFSLLEDQYIEYRALVYHNKTEERIRVDGSIVHKDKVFVIRGSLGSQLYTINFTRDPFMIVSAVHTDKDGNELITCSFSDPSHFIAHMHYETIRTIAKAWYDIFLPGKGLCIVKGSFNDHILSGTLEISDALIRMPGMYNFISHASMQYAYNVTNNLLHCDDLLVKLHKGSIVSKRITLQLPDDTIALFAHIPVTFYHCFINIRKQLHGTITGSLLYDNKNEQSKVSGFCVIEDMNIKDNIFASELYDSLGSSIAHKKINTSSQPTQVAIDISTNQPALISTSVLETSAQCKCFIKNTLEEPLFEGKIYLRGGKVTFPTHSLPITRGKITFVPNQNNDHLLDIVAQGRVKKYLITLMIGGSLQNPTIALQASPSLTQEQIIMLLFAGTEEQSLNVMAPALVMYNTQNFLFNQSAQYETLKNSLIPSWFQPFQKVNFIPRFSDQTGRGGLKGVLEVEVNDRLRAAIEKNFSLSENAAIEVEYLLSDDISLKMSRDDRWDVGAEVEMRFKF